MPEGWNRVQMAAGDALVKEFDRHDFKGSVEFINAILPLAEAAFHHPDLEISWSKVTVTLRTHSAGGVTDRDLALAEQINDLA